LGAYACTLIDEGLLSLDDPVAAYLREVEAPPRTILVSHLLSKSSGLWPKESAALSVSADWSDFCRNVKLGSPRFPPGLIVTHSLFERILLVELLRRVGTGAPYAAMARHFFGCAADNVTRQPSGAFHECYLDMLGTIDDLVMFLDRAGHTSWWDQIGQSAGAVPQFQAPCPKDWVATASGLGLFQFGNGLWGQDGDSNEGFLGLRLCPSSRTAVVGIFGTPFARDHILGRINADLFGVAPPERDGRLGTLNHQDPAALPGLYQGRGAMRFSVEYDGTQLNFPTQDSRRNLPADIHPDGSLTARWAGPTFWLEPRMLPGGDIGIRFSRHFYVKEAPAA